MTQTSQNMKAPKESHIWVRNQIFVGASLSIGLCLAAFHFLPIQITDIKSPADRLVLAVRCIFISTIPVLALFKSIADSDNADVFDHFIVTLSYIWLMRDC